MRPAKELGFVLYGGTAIALRLGHRVSVDFDFFSDQPLDRQSLYDAFDFLGTATLIQDQPGALTFLVPVSGLSVKLSFLGPIRFGRVGKPQLTDDGVMQVASLEDLFATKLKVILQRAESKDYIDIAALLASGMPLEQGLSAARLLFAPHFQSSESLKALIYFGEGDLDSLSPEVRQTLIDAVRAVSDLPDITKRSERLSL